MPEQGVPLLPKDHLLTTDEIERLAKMFVDAGVKKIRLTGGEPTVRKDVVDVVGACIPPSSSQCAHHSLPARLGKLGLSSLGMTSNGIALKRKLPDLVAAGLTHLNISLDTLDTFQYELITRRRGFERVMEALELAEQFPSLTVKINCVVIRGRLAVAASIRLSLTCALSGLNDHEVPAFVELTRNRKIIVRFIEYMPFEGALALLDVAAMTLTKKKQITIGPTQNSCPPPPLSTISPRYIPH